MRIVPDSTITLYKGVDIDNDEQLVFDSLEHQQQYFTSKVFPAGSSYSPCTVVRKNGVLRVERSMAIVSQCNYLSFVNPLIDASNVAHGDGKTVYARIIDYEYVNNECTEITYIIDYWQTWMFDVTFQDMYIEREHLSQADWDKAEINPYDQSILEFKTLENLPYGEDIEKPYYTFGDGTQQTDDGVYCGDAVCAAIGTTNRLGVLIAFSDIDLEYLDTNAAGTYTPSVDLAFILDKIRTGGGSGQQTGTQPLNFYKLSASLFEYLSTHQTLYPVSSKIYTGTGWDVTLPGSSTSTQLMPGSSNLQPPVSYIFIDGGAAPASEFETATVLVSQILDWFTRNDNLNNKALASILGIYAIPAGLAVMCGSEYARPIGASLPTAIDQNVVNKKLDLYPYSYYRVITPNGDVKELRIENFISAQTNASPCTLALSLDIVEKPNLIAAPAGYRAVGASPHNLTANVNVREGLIFSQFPTLPYAIDSFTAQMAAVSNSMIGNNTIQYANEMRLRSEMVSDETIKSALGAGGSTISVGSSLASGKVSGVYSGVVSGASGVRAAMLNEQYARPMLENEASMVDASYRAKLADASENNNALYENFQYTKPAYATAMYNQINGDGVTNYNYNSFMDILFMRVSINPTILAQYDNYFSQFGYTSGRCGIPRVIRYSQGSTSDAEIPHWQTLNGKSTTYIKTRDCKVIHSMLPVASYIKAMFDRGIRMIKGWPVQGA